MLTLQSVQLHLLPCCFTSGQGVARQRNAATCCFFACGRTCRTCWVTDWQAKRSNAIYGSGDLMRWNHGDVYTGGVPGLLGVILYPVAQPQAVGLWTDGREGAARVSQALPPMLQAFPETVHRENVNNADKVALLRTVDDMQRILQVGQQTSVLGPEVLELGFVVLPRRVAVVAHRVDVQALQTDMFRIRWWEGGDALWFDPSGADCSCMDNAGGGTYRSKTPTANGEKVKGY